MSELNQSNTQNIFFPILEEFYPETSDVCPFTHVKMLIDTSGSTNNSGGRSGRFGGGRFASQPVVTASVSDEPVVRTKSIILAEQESAAHMCASLANTFNMSGVHITIAGFGSSCNIMFSEKLQSSKQLYGLAETIDARLIKDFGSTDLTLGLKTIPFDPTEDTLLVILTDGQPNDKASVIVVIDEIADKFKQNGKKLFIFTVGAGSIQQSSGGSASSFSSRGFSNTGLTNITALSRGGSSECDKEYLEFLSEKGFFGTYAGAYGDYSDLKLAWSKFINRTLTYTTDDPKDWHVELDNKFIKMSKEGQKTFESLRLSGRSFALVTLENLGSYVYSFGDEPYQLHVVPREGYHSDIHYQPDKMTTMCFIENIKPEQVQKFNLYSTIAFEKEHSDVVFVAVSPDGSKRYFSPDIKDELYRVRKVKGF